MKKNEDEITELFHSRLKNYEIPLQKDMWDDLESELSQSSSHRMYSICLIAAAAVFLILVACSAAVWMFTPRQPISSALSDASAPAVKKNVQVIKKEKTSLNIPVTEVKETSVSESEEILVADTSLNTEKSDLASIETLSVVQQKDTGNRMENSMLAEVKQNTDEEIKPHFESDWSFGVTASIGGGKELTKIGDDQHQLNINHKTPLTLGLSVSKKLINNLTLESGLNYTVTHSDITDNNASTVTNQTIKYVGIPLKLNWTLINKRKFDLYLSGGALMEECVSAKDRIKYYTGSRLTETEEKSLALNGMQFSFTSSIGFQYNASESLAVYAEPGIAYSLSDHTSAYTLRNNRPVNLYVSCGVKVMY
ncbi:outer membrane beta-barrel protein [Bacteroides sedimenti]|uniref:Outer membrane protein beta-barrel domain-containing protein n=1 Tax=Bacteroides sedimenti TaxID=2136147 RepID=A0ABM8IFL2_9BACE